MKGKERKKKRNITCNIEELRIKILVSLFQLLYKVESQFAYQSNVILILCKYLYIYIYIQYTSYIYTDMSVYARKCTLYSLRELIILFNYRVYRAEKINRRAFGYFFSFAERNCT